LQTVETKIEHAPHTSAFARVGTLVYTLLIVYGSWYPFSGWQSIGLTPWAFVLAPLPHYWTVFDAATNVLSYMPFGALMVLALYPHLRGALAVVLTLLAGSLLSGLMEAGQTFLPTRVSSNLDLITNAGGALIGALVGVLLCRPFLEQSRLLQLRKYWFIHDAGRGLIVIALWPLAQLYPQGYLFGHGQIVPALSNLISQWLSMPVDIAALLRGGVPLTVQEYWLAETIITACGLTGAALTMLCLFRNQAPKAMLVFALAALALLVKALATALLFTPDNAFVWLTPGARGGVLVGAMMIAGLAFARPAAQRRLAIASILVSMVAANAVPINPYFTATLQAWTQGKFLNFNGAAQFIALAWPFLALWFLLHPMHRVKRN